MTARDQASAWVDTIGVDLLSATLRVAARPGEAGAIDDSATIRERSCDTIVPTRMRRSGAHALALLEQLRGRSAAESAHLIHGDVLGEGGMGIVRAAEQVALGRTVAVKTLKQRDPDAALALLREAWVTGALEHPNVVPIHYVELDADGMPLVVMKRIAGVEWSKLIDRADEVERRFGAADLLAWNLGILNAVLNAVRFAHHRGVIHRDLKPSNVMIGDYGEVYLLDWGIALSLRDDPSGRLPVASADRELAGTPAYMAPEMLGRDDGPPLSERTDIYLAGAVLHEIITGAPPHRGNDIISVIASVIASAPQLAADVPAELARICMRAMDENPARRFESAEAMRLALQRYLEHRGSAELAERAAARLGELEAMLAGDAPARGDVHRAFGACRFGFHEALARWPDNADARASLARATIAVAEYELAAGQPAAAETLLADVAVAAPELVARIAAAHAARAAELAAADKLRAEYDPDVGRRTRSFLMAVFGVAFVAIPMVLQVMDSKPDGLDLAGLSVVLEVAVVAAYVWARDSLGATLFNRRLVRAAMFLFGVQIVVGVGTWRIGMPGIEVGLVLMLAWVLASGMIAIAIDARLTPACVGYLAGFAFAVQWPMDQRFAMSAAHLALMVNCVWVWRPETLRPTDDERARLNRAPRDRAR